jgi:hypothetical protein
VSSFPLTYSSGNASHKRDVLGTWFLSILAGQHRYAHITSLRGDGVSPQILGMSKIVSEDTLRRALARMSADQSRDWLRPQLLTSVQPALDLPWILDIDTTIKTLFGKQSGAEVSYNQHKPGRPSHALHTYFVSNLRMVIDVVVSPGKQHSAAHARPWIERHSGQSEAGATARFGARRLRLRQRAVHRRVGDARPALLVQAAPDQRRQEDADAPVCPQGLDYARPQRSRLERRGRYAEAGRVG